MLEDEILVLQKTPWLKSRLSYGHFDTTQVLRFVLETLKDYKAKPADVLTLYGENPSWPIPPRYSEMGLLSTFLPKLPENKMPPKALQYLFEECRDKTVTGGYAGSARVLMESAFGEAALNSMIFSQTSPGEAAGKIFAVEFAIAISNRPGKLTVYGDSCYMRVRGRTNTSITLGLVGKGKVKTPDWLHRVLFDSRGSTNFAEFDVMDRLLEWSRVTLTGDAQQEFQRNLFALKVRGSNELRYRLDKIIHTMELDFIEEEEGDIDEFQALLYTTAAYEQIQLLWSDGDGPDFRAYSDLYEYLVPTYFDHKMWMKFFKVGIVKRSQFNFNHVEMIDSRFPIFKAFFDKQKAKLDRKEENK